MRARRSMHRSAVVVLAAAMLTAGLADSASAGSHAAVPTPITSPTTTAPTATPVDTDTWGDVPGDPAAGTSDPVEPAKAGGSTFAPPPDDPDCNSRDCLMSVASYEVKNADHNREKGADNCNFYSGAWGNSGSLSTCGTYLGTRWRSNNWCSDFARWVWKAGGANTSGIDPWAGSFYRANKTNGHYHSKAGGYHPVKGDAVLYDWDGTPSLGDDGWDIDHVGVFEKMSGTSIVVIEGNTDGGASRDGVFRRTRTTSDVVGYVTPRF